MQQVQWQRLCVVELQCSMLLFSSCAALRSTGMTAQLLGEQRHVQGGGCRDAASLQCCVVRGSAGGSIGWLASGFTMQRAFVAELAACCPHNHTLAAV